MPGTQDIKQANYLLCHVCLADPGAVEQPCKLLPHCLLSRVQYWELSYIPPILGYPTYSGFDAHCIYSTPSCYSLNRLNILSSCPNLHLSTLGPYL